MQSGSRYARTMNATDGDTTRAFPAFGELGFLDRLAYVLPYYAYSIDVWDAIDPDVLPFFFSIATATFCVVVGSYATVAKPKNAADPIEDTGSVFWDPSDRDGSPYIHTNAADLDMLNGSNIGMRQVIAMPLASGAILCALYYCMRNLDTTQLVYYLNWYLLAVSVASNSSVVDYALASVGRKISYWLRRAGHPRSLLKRYRFVVAESAKSESFPLGFLERVNAASFPEKSEEWYRGLRSHLDSQKIELVQPTTIPVEHQKFNLVFDLRFLILVPLSLTLAALCYWHNPTLNSRRTLDVTNWILANMMGVNFAIFGIKVTRLPNFKVAAGLLGVLFLYDVYFVFGTKVMVTVATGIDIPIKIVFPRAPGYIFEKLTWNAQGFKYWDVPTTLLGLGDIVVPGALISACLRFDLHRHHQHNTSAFHHLQPFCKPYFAVALACYIASLVCTVTVLKVYKTGQPALFYIVPALLGGVFGAGVIRGEIGELWAYSEVIEEYNGEGQEHEDSDDEYQGESDDSYDDWEDKVELQRAAFEVDVETDSDDIQVLAADLMHSPTRTMATYTFADSDDEDDDTFLIEDEEEEDEGESSIAYAMVSSDEMARLARDNMDEPRAWYSDEE